MNFRRKCKFFTQKFYHFFREMDHSMAIQPQEQKGSIFFQANDLAFHTHSMRLLSGKAETFYFLKNSTSGSQTVTFKYVSGSGDSVAVANGATVIVFASANDGTNPDILEIPLR